jgi:hypothetical protein
MSCRTTQLGQEDQKKSEEVEHHIQHHVILFPQRSGVYFAALYWIGLQILLRNVLYGSSWIKHTRNALLSKVLVRKRPVTPFALSSTFPRWAVHTTSIPTQCLRLFSRCVLALSVA